MEGGEREGGGTAGRAGKEGDRRTTERGGGEEEAGEMGLGRRGQNLRRIKEMSGGMDVGGGGRRQISSGGTGR